MWTIRRAIVRYAERLCFERGEHFRGRAYPIYARDLIPKIREMRLATTPNRQRRFGASRVSSNSFNSTFTTNFARSYESTLTLSLTLTLTRTLTLTLSLTLTLTLSP